jgi:hypothetical protein
MQYCIARDTDQARLGERRRRLRQFDRADTMFAGLHDRVRQGRALPWQACRDRRTAACRPWPAATDSQTVTLVLDATITARVALSAIASYADEYEPECSWSWCLTITSKSSRSGRRSAVALSRCGNFPCGETSGDHLSNQFAEPIGADYSTHFRFSIVMLVMFVRRTGVCKPNGRAIAKKNHA